MSAHIKTVLILPCAGSGSRFGSCKQLELLHSTAVFIHALRAYAKLVDHVIIPTSKDIRNQVIALCNAERFSFSIDYIEGGNDRFTSVHNGIRACPNNCVKILIHDAVRPCISADHIQQCIERLDSEQAVVLGIPCRDSLKKSVDGHHITESLDRDGVWMAHTPQGIRASIAHDIYQQAADESWNCTDDAGIFERAGIRCALIQGSPLNIKLTWPEDWQLAELILKP